MITRPRPHDRRPGTRPAATAPPSEDGTAKVHRLRDRRRPAPTHPDAARLAALLVRATAEVTTGRRPLDQLAPVLAPSLLRRLAVQLQRTPRGGPLPPAIRRVVTTPPTPSGAIEVTVLVERDGRVTAVAVRLERHRGAWRATELTAPESGYAPLPTRSDPAAGSAGDAFDEAAREGDVTRRRGTA